VTVRLANVDLTTGAGDFVCARHIVTTWSRKLFSSPLLLTMWLQKFSHHSLFLHMVSKNFFHNLFSNYVALRRAILLTTSLLKTFLVCMSLLKSFHRLFSQFTWRQKLLSSPLLLTSWQLKRFSSHARYRLYNSPFLCSANHNLHIPLTTYCLLWLVGPVLH
jgi:hypothetical protein